MHGEVSVCVPAGLCYFKTTASSGFVCSLRRFRSPHLGSLKSPRGLAGWVIVSYQFSRNVREFLHLYIIAKHLTIQLDVIFNKYQNKYPLFILYFYVFV